MVIRSLQSNKKRRVKMEERKNKKTERTGTCGCTANGGCRCNPCTCKNCNC